MPRINSGFFFRGKALDASCTNPAADVSLACECALDGPPPVRTRLRVGSAAGLLDAPVQHALAEGNIAGLSVNLNWVKCPQDASAVVSMLAAGLIDMALMFTEDAVAYATAASTVRICGVFVSTPRTWAVHVPGASKAPSILDVQDAKIGVSDDHGGSVITSVLSQRPGWEQLSQMPRVQFPSLRRACEAMGRENVRAVLWEQRPAKGLVACGEWDSVHEEAMPWPAMVVAASREALYSKAGAIRHFIHYLQGISAEFKVDPDGSSATFLTSRYGLPTKEAQEFLQGTTWPCVCEVAEEHISLAIGHLQAVGILRSDREFDPARVLAKEICSLSSVQLEVSAAVPADAPSAAAAVGEPVKPQHKLELHLLQEDEDFAFSPEPTADLRPSAPALLLEEEEPSSELGSPLAEPAPAVAPTPSGAGGQRRAAAAASEGSRDGARRGPVPAG